MRHHMLLRSGKFIHKPSMTYGFKQGKGYAGVKKKDVQSSRPAITGAGKRIHPLKFKL